MTNQSRPHRIFSTFARHAKWVRIAALFTAAIMFGAILTVDTQSQAEDMDPFGGFGIGGVGSFGNLTPTDAWLLGATPIGLNDLDPLSGAVIDDMVDSTSAFSYAATTHLMESGQMAIDAADLARRAQEELERKRKAEESKTGVAVKRSSGYGYPEEWELEHFSACGYATNADKTARVEVVLAFEQMCQAALADGVKLGIIYGYRSIELQSQLWESRISREMASGKTRTEAEAAARKWVAPPGRSQHNRGIAIDLNTSRDAAVYKWIHTPVGCYSPPDALRLGVTDCNGNEEVVKRAQLYGFVLPLDHEPWHIELGITITPITAGLSDCNPNGGLSVPEMIGAIFRCRLDEAGYSPADRERIVAEAVVVAKCESGWHTDVIAYGGRYLHTPNPATGKYYSAKGVFQFIKTSAERWIPGGWANADDPVLNIDGAVRYYMWEREQGREGWQPWSCRNTYLPQYGGNSIPSWAYNY